MPPGGKVPVPGKAPPPGTLLVGKPVPGLSVGGLMPGIGPMPGMGPAPAPGTPPTVEPPPAPGFIGTALVAMLGGGKVGAPPGKPGGIAITPPVGTPGKGVGTPPGIVVALVETVGMPGIPPAPAPGIAPGTPAFKWPATRKIPTPKAAWVHVLFVFLVFISNLYISTNHKSTKFQAKTPYILAFPQHFPRQSSIFMEKIPTPCLDPSGAKADSNAPAPTRKRQSAHSPKN